MHVVDAVKYASRFRHKLGAKHNLLLAEQTDGAERAREVVVVDVGWNAIVHLIYIDNCRVWLIIPVPVSSRNSSVAQLGIELKRSFLVLSAKCCHIDIQCTWQAISSHISIEKR